jgi:transcriptional regulator GlxA family with amidase domain
MHRVAVVALDGVVPFDLVTPVQVFGMTRLATGEPGYEVRVCGEAGGRVGPFGLGPDARLDDVLAADTVVVPGHHDALAPPDPRLVDLLVRAAAGGARLASICVGAFPLAATGLLDDRRATTHWRWAGALAERHPRVAVDADVLFVDEGDVLTSAGIVAGLDLCLHLVRRDNGAAVAVETARHLVMPLQRDGGQAQFIVHADPVDGGSLQPVLEWMERNLADDLPLAAIADRAAMSVRTLSRRFRDQTGTTPLQWLQRARIARARQLLETTDLPIDRVAEQCGFGSPASFRAHFTRIGGTSPSAYRAAFRES